MQMLFALLLIMMPVSNNGVQINTLDNVVIVRTDSEPVTEHHYVLDDTRWSRLKPFTVTLRTKGDVAIHAIVVDFSVVDSNGVRHEMTHFYDGPNDGKFAVVFPGSATAFWPNGRVMKSPPPYRSQNSLPLMSSPNADLMTMLENAQSVTFSVLWIEFADGTVYDAGGQAAKVAASRQNMAAKGWR